MVIEGLRQRAVKSRGDTTPPEATHGGASQVHAGKRLHVVVTGTNSGVGFGTLCRLIDEFLTTKPYDTLVLMFSTRTREKSDLTIFRLVPYLNSKHGVRWPIRVELIPFYMELSCMKSVLDAARFLRSEVPKIDALILNAGMFAFVSFDWILMLKELWRDMYTAFTYPCYKIQEVRSVTTQLDPEKGVLGTVFCSNVFGHYFFSHQLMGLLAASDYYEGPGRVVWMSSLEAYDWAFKIHDMQGLRTPNSYESVKRLMDVLALTAYEPANADALASFCTPPGASSTISEKKRPLILLAHPGVCATKFVKKLPFIMAIFLVPAFIFCRYILRSIWHTVYPYEGAKASTVFALSSHEEASNWIGKKAGSSMPAFEKAQVRETEALKPDEESWIELGRSVWCQMEELREEWEARFLREGIIS